VVARAAADELMDDALARAVGRLLDAVGASASVFEAPDDIDGARRMTAVAYLMRGAEVLQSAHQNRDARPLVELAVRPIYEFACRGRHLLVHPDGAEEFTRVCHELVELENRRAPALGTSAPGLPAFLQSVLAQPKKPPRDMWSIAHALDDHDQRGEDDRFSARRGYHVLYGALSASAVHAGLQSIKRFTAVRDDGCLHLAPHPPALTTGWPVPVAAAWLGELAHDVFRDFGLDTNPLDECGVRLPERGRGGVGDHGTP